MKHSPHLCGLLHFDYEELHTCRWRIWIAIKPTQHWEPGMRFRADNVYGSSPQPTTEGYSRLLCSFDTTNLLLWITGMLRREKRGKGEGWQETDSQTDRSRACWRNTKCMQMERRDHKMRNQWILLTSPVKVMHVQGVENGGKGNKYREKRRGKMQRIKLGSGNIKGIINVKLCLVPDSLG